MAARGAGATALPNAAGVLLGNAEDREAQSWIAALREELVKLGWTEGHNVQIDIRSAPADVASMRRFAKELAALQPNLIVTESTPAAGAMLEEARTIPVVFTLVADPVGSGFVATLPRPGGNATGFTPIVSSLGGTAQGDCATHRHDHIAV